MRKLFVFLIGAAALAQNAPDHPSVTAQGKTFTPRSILARNMGRPEDQTTAFPPHKIVGNIYYVGTKTLSSFLIVTPQGNILIDSTYERNVRTIQKSIEQLGFKFSDTRILLGNHAHGDQPRRHGCPRYPVPVGKLTEPWPRPLRDPATAVPPGGAVSRPSTGPACPVRGPCWPGRPGTTRRH